MSTWISDPSLSTFPEGFFFFFLFFSLAQEFGWMSEEIGVLGDVPACTAFLQQAARARGRHANECVYGWGGLWDFGEVAQIVWIEVLTVN
jgi:hypothetical protein